ncbi:MAG TPA: dTDP-4-dehydrorhamnose reductase [Magnetovibrio sp.]
MYEPLDHAVRLLVFGETGQLSKALRDVAFPNEWKVTYVGRREADITDAGAVNAVVQRLAPNIVINTAAYTNVDGAESEQDLAYAVNRDGAANVARAATAQGAPIIHVSTDFVFSGAKDTPYLEDDPVGPVNVYGASKEAGERAVRDITPQHAIVRTAWLYSAGQRNFVTAILGHMSQKKTLQVVSDQIGSPTYAPDLAEALLAMAQQILGAQEKHYGTFHAANSGSVSRFDFARAIQAAMTERLGKDWAGGACEVLPIPTTALKLPAERPKSSILNCDKLHDHYGIQLPQWEESLRRCIALI